MTSTSIHSGNVHEPYHEPAAPGGEHRGSGTDPGKTGPSRGGAASSATTNRETQGAAPRARTGAFRSTRPIGNGVRTESDHRRPGTKATDGGLPDRSIAHLDTLNAKTMERDVKRAELSRARVEYDRAKYDLGATMQNQARAGSRVSTLENDVASLESELLRLKQQLGDRERDRFEVP